MSTNITRSSTLRTSNTLTVGQLNNWLQSLEAPENARVRVTTDVPPRGEFGATVVRIEATWEEPS